MASMKLYKPSYSYGATSNFSESHQEYSSSQSSYGNNSWANNNQARGMAGRSMHSYGDDAFGHASGIKPTNYYAQAQCAQPSPSVNVVQSSHMESMKRQESHKGQQWAGGSPACASPTQSAHSEFAMHKEEHMMEKADQGWVKKPNLMSGAGQANQYGLAMHKEEHMMGKMEQGWASKPNHSVGAVAGGQYGLSGKVGQGWANNGSQGSGPIIGNQRGVGMNDLYEDEQDECDDSPGPGQYLSPIRTNNAGLGIHKENHMMGKMDQGWANSSTNFSGPQGNSSNHAMYKEEHMMGKMGHGASAPTNFSGPNPASNSGLKMYKEEHVTEKSDLVVVIPATPLPGPVQGNHIGQSMYKEQGAAGHMYGANGANGGWANQPGKYSGSNQLGHSGNNMYKEQGQHGYGAGQFNQSAHATAQNGFGPAQINHSAHGVAQNKYGAAQVNHSAHGVGQNGFGGAQANHSSRGIAQNGYAAAQNGYGGAQVNSAHGAYNFHEEDHEGVHDIMDEILTKYPAHNVSGGNGSNWAAKSGACATQNQASSFGRQQSFGGPAQYGNVTQSSSNKFEMKKDMKAAGYMGNNMKQEYSRSSSSNKFEANGVMNNINGGGSCHNLVEDDCGF